MLDLVIFSKDRACQLDLLLRSLERQFVEWRRTQVTVIYTFSDPDFAAGYAATRMAHPDVAYICERDSHASFRDLTLSRIGAHEHVMFLVDDDVFKDEFTVESPEYRTFAATPEIACLSLRMAPHMEYCYAYDRSMARPEFEAGNVWDWTTAEYDWNYPMSLDGHVFRTEELRPLLAEAAFHNPNSLEAALAARPLANPKMICFSEAKIVNLPVNRVQETALNRHGGIAATWLNEQFLAGQRLSETTVRGTATRGPHEELPLRWEPWDPPLRSAEGSPRSSSRIVVMLVDEVLAAPRLLADYLTIVEDAAKLVLYAPDGDPDRLSPALEALAAEVGLDQPESPQVEVLVVPSDEGEASLRSVAHALVTDRADAVPLQSLPRFGSDALAALAEALRRPSHAPTPPGTRPTEPDLPAPIPSIVAHRPPGWDWFVEDLRRYRGMPGGEQARDEDLNPQLNDRTPGNPYDQHYFFQDVWAARRVAEARPERHVDVGSRIDFVGFLTALTQVVFVDIRELTAEVEGLSSVVGSVLAMPFESRSLESVSCLHVAEHIGLGRYGDPLDPEGTVKAIAELQRVVAPGGRVLFSGPVGRERTCFNAHRIHDPRRVPVLFDELELIEFSGVDDAGAFRRFRALEELAESTYACGMYVFQRPAG